MPVFIAFTHLLFPLFCFHPPNFLNHLLCSRCSSCSPFHILPCSSHSTLIFSLYSALLTLLCIFQSTMLFTLCSSNSTLLLSLQSALLTLLCSSLSYLLLSLYSAPFALPFTLYSVHSISLFSLYSSYFASFCPFLHTILLHEFITLHITISFHCRSCNVNLILLWKTE